MIKKIRTTDRVDRRISDTSTLPTRVAAGTVEAALGAETSDKRLEEVLAPITLFAVRSELLGRLQSTGGRPALAGTSRRAKIPLGDKEWADLEKLAAAVSAPGLSPSAGQIATVLLTLSARSVIAQLGRSPQPASPSVARDLATRAAAASARRAVARRA